MTKSVLNMGKDSNGDLLPMGATTDSAGDPAGNVLLPDGLGSNQAGEDFNADVTRTEQQFQHKHCTADTSVKASSGFVHAISFAPIAAAVTAGMITVYDNTAESGTIIYREWFQDSEFAGHTVIIDAVAINGIYVGFDGTVANVNCTVSYR